MSNLFYTYSSTNGTYAESVHAVQNNSTYTYSLVFDEKRGTIWAQDKEYGRGIPVVISGQAPNSTYAYVINAISVSNNNGTDTISYSYINVPSYAYISTNYETITYVRDAYTYIIDTIEENEYITAQALTDLDTRVTNIEDDYVTYSDLNSYIGAHSYITHAQVNNVLASYINSGTATNTGYVIGKIGMNGHTLSYAYVTVPTYEYLNGGYVNNVSLTKSGSGNIVKEITISKTTTGGVNSYVIDVSYTNIASTDTYTYFDLETGANNSGKYVNGIELVYSGTSPVTYTMKVAYADIPSITFHTNAKNDGEAITGITSSNHKLTMSYSYFANPKYLADFGYVKAISGGSAPSGNGGAVVINGIGKNGQTITYSYARVATLGDIPSVPDVALGGSAATAGQAATGFAVDSSNKHKINVSYSYFVTPKYLSDFGYVHGNGYVTGQYLNDHSYIDLNELNEYLNSAGYATTGQIPTIPDVELGGSAATAGQAATGFVVDSSNKHKINVSYSYFTTPKYLADFGYVKAISGGSTPSGSGGAVVISGIGKNGQTITYSYTRVATLADIQSDSNTYTYVSPGTGTAAAGNYVSAIEISSSTSGNIITYTIQASYSNLPGIKFGTNTPNDGYAATGFSQNAEDPHKIDVTYSYFVNPKYLDDFGYVYDIEGDGSAAVSDAGKIKVINGIGHYRGKITYSYTEVPIEDTNSYIAAITYANNNKGLKLDFKYANSSYSYSYIIPRAGTSYGVVKVGSGTGLVGMNASGQLTYTQPDITGLLTASSIEGMLTSYSYLYSYTVAKSGLKISNGYKVTYDGAAGTLTNSANSYGDIYVPVATTSAYGVVKTGSGNGLVGMNASGQLTYTQPTVGSGTLTLKVGGATVTGNNTFTANIGENKEYNVPVMTSSVYGVAKTYHDTTVSAAINSASTDAGRWYGVQKNSDGKLVVNVPWSSSSTSGFITGADIAYSYEYPYTLFDNSDAVLQLTNSILVTYSNGSVTTTTNPLTDIWVPKASTAEYGVVKIGSGEGFVGIDANGRLTYEMPDDPEIGNGALVLKAASDTIASNFTANINTNKDYVIPKMSTSAYGVAKIGTGSGFVGIDTTGHLTYNVPSMTDTVAGIACAYYDLESDVLPIASSSYPSNGDPSKNYGVAIDNSGKLSVYVPWEGAQISLTSSGTGDRVSSISLNNGVLTVSYTQSSATSTQVLEQAIIALQLEYDSLFSYNEVGLGFALHKTTSGGAYIDLTNFSGGGGTGGGGMSGITQSSTNSGIQLSLTSASGSTTIAKMTATSYGVAKLGKSGVLSDVDPASGHYPVQITSTGQLGVDLSDIETNNQGTSMAKVVHYGICNTAQGTGAKTVDNVTGFVLEDGAMIYVRFNYANTHSTPSLKVNPTTNDGTSKAIRIQNGTTVETLSSPGLITTGKTFLFRYNGTYWVIIDIVEDGGSGSGSGTGTGTDANAVHWDTNSGTATGVGPVQTIQVASSPGTDVNTLYIIL